MAFAKGKVASSETEFKRYIGCTPVNIVAINPTKVEYETIFNNRLETEPEYIGTRETDNGSVKTARINIVLKTTDENPVLFTINFFLENRPMVSASGKKKIIDKYGRTYWATPEEISAHTVPIYKDGPARISKDYRLAWTGEEELVEFVKTFLRIEGINIWDNSSNSFKENPAPENCECLFDNISAFFKGDFSEIKEALGNQPTNDVVIMTGVRNDANTGRLYQVVYNKKFAKSMNTLSLNGIKKALQADIDYAIQSGRTLNTEYSIEPLREYKVEATDFTTPNNVQSPVEDNSINLPFNTDPFTV